MQLRVDCMYCVYTFRAVHCSTVCLCRLYSCALHTRALCMRCRVKRCELHGRWSPSGCLVLKFRTSKLFYHLDIYKRRKYVEGSFPLLDGCPRDGYQTLVQPPPLQLPVFSLQPVELAHFVAGLIVYPLIFNPSAHTNTSEMQKLESGYLVSS